MIKQISSPTIEAEFITFSQEGIDISGLQNCCPILIYALTVAEDFNINQSEDLGEFFITCMN